MGGLRSYNNTQMEPINNSSDGNILSINYFDIYDIVFFFFFYVEATWIFLANLLVIVTSCRYSHLQKPYGKEITREHPFFHSISSLQTMFRFVQTHLPTEAFMRKDSVYI